MNKKYILLIVISIILLTSLAISIFSSKSSNSNDINTVEYEPQKVNTNTTNNTLNSSELDLPRVEVPAITENNISNFTTTIYSTDSARQNNINICVNSLNGTIIPANEIFSFTNTIGPANSDSGYMESDIFDSEGNKIKGFGGGICQVSTTLYNAVLAVPNLEIIERHPHSQDVPYISDGLDAAVSYGSIDFKFRNTLESDIKIYATTTNSEVTINLVSLE